MSNLRQAVRRTLPCAKSRLVVLGSIPRVARARDLTPRSSSSLFSTPRPFSTSAPLFKTAIRFTAEHEWVKLDDENNVGVIGITDYAQNSLGDVVYVELPSEGSEVKQGEQIGAVESVKAASDIYSPVTGVIKEVNDKLGDEPGLLNKSPEEKGWLCKIQLSNPAEFDVLLGDEAYKKLSEDA